MTSLKRKRRAHATGCVLVAMSLTSAWLPRAFAQDANGRAKLSAEDEHARDLFEQGRVAYQDARYELALDLFMQAYALSKRPELLNNIGAAADRLRMDAEALDAYQRYLAQVPSAENRAAIENRIAALKAVLEGKQAEATPVPTPAETARAASEQPASSPLQAPAAAHEADEDSGSVLSSWWLWAGLGVVAIAGVAVGVAATSKTETVDGPTPVVDGATRVIEL